MDDDTEWQNVISQYFAACLKDAWVNTRNNERSRFMDQFAAANLISRSDQCNEKRIAELKAQTVPNPADCTVVKRTSLRVIAQYDKDCFMDFFRPTRFVLTKLSGTWQLEDILWQCHCKHGRCNLCEGRGHCEFCHGTGRDEVSSEFLECDSFGYDSSNCLVCSGDPTCSYCRGSGRCSYCSNSGMPGWHCQIGQSGACSDDQQQS